MEAADLKFISVLHNYTKMNPLSNSSRQNTTINSVKDTNTLAHKVIDEVISSQDIGKKQSDVVKNGVLCLYHNFPKVHDALFVLKKHQSFLLRLLACKQYDCCLEHLFIMKEVMSKQFDNRKLFNLNHESLVEELMQGIPFTEELQHECQLHNSFLNLTLAFHFITAQCLLQSISLKLKHIVANKKSSLSTSLFETFGDCFLSTSNFIRWILHSHTILDENSIVKHDNNILKLLNGCLKLFHSISVQCPSIDLLLTKSIFSLKSIEFNYKKSGLFESTLLKNITHHETPVLQPYINDLSKCIDLHEFPELNNLLKGPNPKTNVSEAYILDLMNGVTKSPDSLSELRESLLHPEAPTSLFSNPEYINRFITFFHQQSSNFSLTNKFMSIIIRYASGNVDQLHCLKGIQFTFLDLSITYIKEVLHNYGPSFESFIYESTQQLFTILSKFDQYKRVGNLANIYFGLGLKSQRFRSGALKSAVEYDFFAYNIKKEEKNIANRQLLQRKLEKSAYHLIRFKQFNDSSDILLVALEHLIQPDIKNPLNSRNFDNKFLLDLICDTILGNNKFGNKVFGKESKINDNLKTSLIIGIFRSIHFNDNLHTKQNLIEIIFLQLLITDISLKLACFYYYYSVGGIKSYRDILEENREEYFSYLFLSGINLQKTINHEWRMETLDESVKYFIKYLLFSPEINYLEIDILSSLIGYLKYNRMFGHILQLYPCLENRNELKEEEKLRYLYYIELEYGTACLNQRLYPELSKVLTKSAKDLKLLFDISKANGTNRAKSSDLMNWKLLQLEYFMAIEDLEETGRKYEATIQFAESKREFNLNHQGEILLEDKLFNLITIAKLQLIAGKINFHLSDFPKVFGSIKTAIKLLLPILQKAESHIPKASAEQIKWTVVGLLFDSFLTMIDALKISGVSREINYYVNELQNLNNSNIFPLVNCQIHFHLSDTYTQLANLDKAYPELCKGNELFNHKDTTKSLEVQRINSNLLFYSLKESAIENAKNFNHYLSLKSGIRNEESIVLGSNMRDLLSEFNYFVQFFKDVDIELDKNDICCSIIFLKNRFKKWVGRLHELPVYNDIFNSVILSTTFTENEAIIQEGLVDIVNEIDKIRSSFIEIIEQHRDKLAIYLMKDIMNYILLCDRILTTLGLNKKSESRKVFYLKDFERSRPFMNDIEIRNQTISDQQDILPKELTQQNSNKYNEIDFIQGLEDYLPDNWSIITIDFCSYSNSLVMTRLSKDTNLNPLNIWLPLQRNDNNVSLNTLGFKEAIDQLNAVIRRSDESIKPHATSKIKTKEERKKWWRLRFSLDIEIQEILEKIESDWLGAFKTIFHRNKNESKFSEDLNDLINEIIPSRRSKNLNGCEKLMFDESMINLFRVNFVKEDSADYQDHENEIRHISEDVLYFILDSLSYRGEHNEYDEVNVDLFHEKFKQLLNKTIQTPAEKEHIILIPGADCSKIPWESLSCMTGKSVSRMPSVDMVIDAIKRKLNPSNTKKSDVFYMINPGGDLLRTEQRFQHLFTDRLWEGTIGRVTPKDNDMVLKILDKDLFVYMGHGGCEQYIRTSSMFKHSSKSNNLPSSLLIGCSSGALESNGIFPNSGNTLNWLTCGSPMVLANLWDVTDKDIDLFSMAMFDHCSLFDDKVGLSVCEGVCRSRHSCNLKYLNGSAPIVYGLPLYIDH